MVLFIRRFFPTISTLTKLVLAGQALVSLVGDPSTPGQGDVRLRALADDEDVGQTGGEGVAVGVLDVDDVEGSGMPLAVDDGSDSTGVATSGDHAKVAGLELDEVHDLAGVDVKAKRIVDLDK